MDALDLPPAPSPPCIAIIGSGPAGLAAAEVVSAAGLSVHVFDAMPSFGRKFLMAGKSGLNITHAENINLFLERYGHDPRIKALVSDFEPSDIIKWMQTLGIEAHTGPTGRVFPSMMKASPLLRSWLNHLYAHGVTFYPKHRWTGWTQNDALSFETPDGTHNKSYDATILALGGKSWSRLGSNGLWARKLEEKGIEISPFQASNSGFRIEWSDRLKKEFAGHPIKACELRIGEHTTRSEFVLTTNGIESGGVYTLSAPIMQTLIKDGSALIALDLLPDISRDTLHNKLSKKRGKTSLSNHIRKTTGLSGAKLALIFETENRDALQDIERLTARIKYLPLRITGHAPIDEAISTSGGIKWSELDPTLMLKKRPGVFCAGEMIDWDAPTGGYLITACLATGKYAGKSARHYLESRQT